MLKEKAMRITENSRTGRAICAISNFGLSMPWVWLTTAICAPTAWIINRYGEQPIIGDDWNDLDAKEDELRAILSR
jgi:hypothetical protein